MFNYLLFASFKNICPYYNNTCELFDNIYGPMHACNKIIFILHKFKECYFQNIILLYIYIYRQDLVFNIIQILS